MCVGFWSLEHPDYALILCSNRDEYLSRPTSHAHWHTFEKVEDASQGAVLSGRDLRAGGTWLGINRYGDVAFITNITEEAKPYESTRGELTSSFLLPDHQAQDLHEYIRGVVDRNTCYAGFNLMLFSPKRSCPENAASSAVWSYTAALVTNHGGGGDITSRSLSPAECRCAGLSNGIDGLGTESWPKVQHGSRLFLDVLQQSQTPDTTEADLVERLFNLLTWRSEQAPRARGELRNAIQIEPLEIPLPKSADGPFYATRLSTVILVRRDGGALLVERDMWTLDANGHPAKANHTSERRFKFRLEPSAK